MSAKIFWLATRASEEALMRAVAAAGQGLVIELRDDLGKKHRWFQLLAASPVEAAPLIERLTRSLGHLALAFGSETTGSDRLTLHERNGQALVTRAGCEGGEPLEEALKREFGAPLARRFRSETRIRRRPPDAPSGLRWAIEDPYGAANVVLGEAEVDIVELLNRLARESRFAEVAEQFLEIDDPEAARRLLSPAERAAVALVPTDPAVAMAVRDRIAVIAPARFLDLPAFPRFGPLLALRVV